MSDAVRSQLAIVLLDAATLWMLIRSLGESASPSGVFSSLAGPATGSRARRAEAGE